MARRGVLFVCLALIHATGPLARSAQVVSIENPAVDFSVTDAPLDGTPDSLTSVFGSVGLGLTGEERSIAEFDVAQLALSPGQSVSGAVFEVKVLEIAVAGYGISNDTPDELSLYGFFGDGVEDLADFGNGTLLGSLDSSGMLQHQVYSFDVTAFVQSALQQRQQFVGLNLRAGELGLTYMREGGADVSQEGFPKLRLTVTPEPGSWLLLAVGGLSLLALSRLGTHRRS